MTWTTGYHDYTQCHIVLHYDEALNDVTTSVHDHNVVMHDETLSDVNTVGDKINSFHKYIGYLCKSEALFLADQVPSCDTNFTWDNLVYEKFAYLDMLFILEKADSKSMSNF